MTTLIDAPPTAPTRSMAAAVYVSAFNAFLAWLVTAVAEMNTQAGENNANATASAASAAASAASATSSSAAAAAAIMATGYAATTSTGLSIAVQAATAIVLNEAGKSFALNDQIVLIERSNPNNRLYATIAGYTDAQHFTINVASPGLVGSGGPYTDWVVLSGVFAMPEASVADIWAQTSTFKTVTPALLAQAAAFQTLTDASTIAWDIPTNGFNTVVTIAGNRTVGAPTNLTDGQSVILVVVQDATGSRTLSWNSIWDFGIAGTPVLSTAAGKIDWIFGTYRAATGKIRAGFNRSA